MMMMMTWWRLWEAGQQPVQERWLLWWPSPRGEEEPPWRSGGFGSGRGRCPGSNSTSRPSVGPSAGPAVHRWSTWCPCTTPAWPRPLGCPQRFARRPAPPEDGVWDGVGIAYVNLKPEHWADNNSTVKPEDVSITAHRRPHFMTLRKRWVLSNSESALYTGENKI